jgi:hypothetical protein
MGFLPSLYPLPTHSLDPGRFSQQAGVRCLVPCHFFGEVDFDLSEIEAEISAHYTGRLIIPRNLEKVGL